MRLTINNVQKHDYGMYKCVAKNPRGETDGTIRLYCKYSRHHLQHIFRRYLFTFVRIHRSAKFNYDFFSNKFYTEIKLYIHVMDPVDLE